MSSALLVAAWLAIGIVCSGIAMMPGLTALEALLGTLEFHVPRDRAYYSPLAYFCLLSLVYVLERRIPACKQARNQPFFSASFCEDAVWYLATMVFRVTFLGLYVAMLTTLYRQHLDFLTVEATANWSAPSRFLAALLVSDFTQWLSHLIRHKVPLFWTFHATHHSQRNLNLFTDARVHPVDRLISWTLRLVPMLALGNDAPVILGWALFLSLYPKLYHANVRLNFGPLRYLLVTPQSHRVHHALEADYQDRNFGFIFCIWDRLFGTHYENDFDFPATGVADPELPHEQSRDLMSLGRIFLLQVVYPFRQVFQNVRRGVPTSEWRQINPSTLQGDA